MTTSTFVAPSAALAPTVIPATSWVHEPTATELTTIPVFPNSTVAPDLKFEPVSGEGAIYAYTIMYHAGDKRFAAAIPYASIIVELDDAPGALLAGNLLDAPYTEAKVGRRVEVIFEPLNDDITLPQFRLAREAS